MIKGLERGYIFKNVERICCLHSIKWARLWIPVTMNYDPIVAFVNEMCTTTDVVKARSVTDPVVQLLEARESEYILESKKAVISLHSPV